MHVWPCWSAAALLCGMSFAQSAEKPTFLVADVHSAPPTTQPFVRAPFYMAGRYELRFATMLDLSESLTPSIRKESRAGRTGWSWTALRCLQRHPRRPMQKHEG
jgi:hypothetical protein